ncbi:MAG: IS110 family transposase [Acidimicrobiales bacterium]
MTLVGMEATGVYWKPVHWVLEASVPEVWVINARHMRNLPGRKTDVADAVWGASLLEHGLVRPSFIPPAPFRALRDLSRYRKSVIEERARESQRLHKVLEDAGVKLSSVASSVLTKSGREMIDALIGQRDAEVLAEKAKGRMRSKISQLEDAMAGRFNCAERCWPHRPGRRHGGRAQPPDRRAVGPLRGGGDVAGDDPRRGPTDRPGDPR